MAVVFLYRKMAHMKVGGETGYADHLAPILVDPFNRLTINS
jgi:hypothetical protein